MSYPGDQPGSGYGNNNDVDSPFADDHQFKEVNFDSDDDFDFQDSSLRPLPKQRSILRKPLNVYSPKTPSSNSRNGTPKFKKSEQRNFSYDQDQSSSRVSFDSIAETPLLKHNATFLLENDENEDEESHNYQPKRGNTIMKRHRFGTLKNKKGKPIGRSKTFKWARNLSIRRAINTTSNPHHPESDSEDEGDSKRNDFRQVYWNLPLPDDKLDAKGEPIVQYERNKIRTTKYTPLTFIPKNLFYQFKNVANIYFLTMIILGAFSIFGVPSPVLSAVPLIVIVCITAFKDALEDSRRTGLDMELNNTPTHLLSGVTNPNCLADNVSLWRRFKKLNTKLLFMFINFCKLKMTKEGRLKAKRDKYQKRHGSDKDSTNRNSMDSFEAGRKSMQLQDLSNPFGDPNGGAPPLNPNLKPFTDRSLLSDTNVRFNKSMWKNVTVGDIVRVNNNDEVPADLVILATSDEDGACYVETKDLDGETNLKVRQALKCSANEIRHSRDLCKLKFWIESEGPHANLYSYQGNLKYYVGADEQLEIANEPITINNTLLRGCTLRNTKWAIGICLFTGADTKIRLNAGITPTKRSRITRELNYPVLLNFVLLFILCFISGLVNGIYYRDDDTSRTFFEYGTIAGNPATNGIVSFFVAVILYQSLVPISLYISIEIIKTAQAFFIYSDVNMYYERLDYPCTPKSWNISDDLGQIEYIFSDKTGTLTQNVMEFKKATINGVSYGRAYTELYAGIRKRQGIDVKEESTREKQAIEQDKVVMYNALEEIHENPYSDITDLTFISTPFVQDLNGDSGVEQRHCNEHFMLTLALCHSVLTEEDPKRPGKLLLKAQSPDEAALVATARDMGFSLVGRTKRGVILNVQGVEKEYQVLNILEFNSTRKRMSAIIKIPAEEPNGEPSLLLLCKGADSIIYSRLSGENDPLLLEKTSLDLETYATEGLRTLCIAQRKLTWSQYEEWNSKHEKAAAALVRREEQMEEVADAIERELILLGGTAIEDRLQDGVPDSIALLADAGIKLWVLTGDKIETAINIGFSCNLLDNDMELLLIKTSGVEDMDKVFSPEEALEIGDDPKKLVERSIARYLEMNFDMTGSMDELAKARDDHKPPHGNYGLIIDGDALKLALKESETQRKFLLLCKQCKAVLCCRVSPAQKAAVVKMVKNDLKVMTLAIGDGSNDVAMIQAADVGVGIAGEEGRAAVMSSDYAFGQFRYLTRLVLVHGRWSYKRLSEMIPSFFYKNAIYTMALFWYGIYNNFDGSYLFEYTYLMFYNLAFTSLPVIFLGILDQDVSDKVSLLVPQLYRTGILRSEWTMQKFWWYTIDAFYQSIISFFYPYWVYYKNGFVIHNGLGLDHRYLIGALVSTIAIFACNFYILMNQYRWDWLSVLLIAISNLLVFAWTGVWSSAVYSAEFYKSAARLYGATSFWACLVVGVVICLIPRFIYNVIRDNLHPRDVTIIRERIQMGWDPAQDYGDGIPLDEIVGNGDYNDFSFRGQDLLHHNGGGKQNRIGSQPNYSSLTIDTQEIPLEVQETANGRRVISLIKK